MRSGTLRTTLILATIVFALDASATTVWTWVDEDGVRHYAQTPIPGASRVDIPASNRAAPYVAAPASSPTARSRQADAREQAAKYASFSIVEPAEGATLHNIGGVVPVRIRLDPALREHHDLVFYVNDRPVGGVAPTATSFELKGVPPGTHLLVAVVRDEQRKPLQEAAVTFYVRQTIIKKPVQPLPKQN